MNMAAAIAFAVAIFAGIFFPVTFAIIAAYKATERK